MAKKRKIKTTKQRHSDDIRLIVFLAIIIIVVLMSGRTDSVQSTDGPVAIKDVTTKEISETTYIFYYSLENTENRPYDCAVTVDISGKPYVTKVSLGPRQIIQSQTQVEMPLGDSTIEISTDCV